MSCSPFIEVCSCSGSVINLIAPSTGVYTMVITEFRNQKSSFEVSVTEGNKFTTQDNRNENSIQTLQILDEDGELITIDGVDKWYLKFMLCPGATTTPTATPADTFKVYYKDWSEDIDLQGVVVDDVNLTAGFNTTFNTVMTFPSFGDNYDLEIFVDTGKYIEGFHYEYDRITGAVTFTNPLESSLLELKFTRK